MAQSNPIGRFSNLEFTQPPGALVETGETLSDEAQFLELAQRQAIDWHYEPALRSFAKVLEFNPKNAVAWTGQVRMLIELGEYREANLWANKALERFPNEPELLASKAVALGREGDLKGALAYSDAAFESRGEGPYLWLARADVMLAREETKADYCFEKARILAAGDWRFYCTASRILFYYRKFALALKAAQEALSFENTRSVLWLQAGLCQQELGMLSVAQASFEHALELDASCELARSSLLKLQDKGFFYTIRGFWFRYFSR